MSHAVAHPGRRLTKRLQPTGRGAASSTPKRFEPRPAAEARVVMQALGAGAIGEHVQRV